ncbi:MAG: tyrosine recombinase [Ruminococcaceae bacterium]|nr:tyrosine recombinase [Oscillospiraceae bacterium]
MEEYMTGFFTFLKKEKGATASTMESYRRDLNGYLCFLAKEQIDDLLGVDSETVEQYLSELSAVGKAGTTVARNLSSIRSMYHYFVEKGLLQKDPTLGLHIDRGEKKTPKILTNLEVELLLEQPKSIDSKGCRDKAMLELLYATGMRVSELIALNVEDVNLQERYIQCGEGEHKRKIPLYETAVYCLSEYLKKARPYLVYRFDEYSLFVNCKGGRFSRQGFWKLLKHYQNMAGLKKEITPQILRQSFAIHLLENGADVRSMQQLMGHVSSATTQGYARIAKERIRDVYHRTHPRA